MKRIFQIEIEAELVCEDPAEEEIFSDMQAWCRIKTQETSSINCTFINSAKIISSEAVD